MLIDWPQLQGRNNVRLRLVAAANQSLVHNASANDTNAQAARAGDRNVGCHSQARHTADDVDYKQLMDNNYGTAGAAVCRLPGRNHANVQTAVNVYTRHFQDELNIVEGERFWLAAATTRLSVNRQGTGLLTLTYCQCGHT
jgi:hypothetical protein